MKNIININEASGSYNVAKENGADAVLISFKNTTGTDHEIEVYKGNEFFKMVACREIEGNTEATMPHEIFTGNNIHFRLIQDGTPGHFFHVIFEPKKAFVFDPETAVIFSNTKGMAQLISGLDLNTYDKLGKYKNQFLESFNFGYLRGGAL